MKRFICKRCQAPIRKWNKVCYSCGYSNDHLVRKLRIARILKALIITASVIGCIAILNSQLLFPWQRGARRNKQVILEYAAEHYPEASFVEGHYNSAKFFIWNNWVDAIIFNLNGIEFKVTAERGEILIDGYPKARAIAQFDEIIQDGFLKPRGITAYTHYRFVDNYYEIYPYTGGLEVDLTIWDQGSTPKEMGWLYDFYKYWKKEGEFLRLYSVSIDIVADEQRMCHIDYREFDNFPDEEKFYSAFKVG